MDDRLAALRRAARAGGALALRHFENRDALALEAKGPQDWVSRADREVEALIARELGAAFPDDGFLGEETAAQFAGGIDRGLWIVDPIDGTHNFLRGVRYWCVSIGYWRAGERLAGAVYDPCHDELFVAVRGRGAWCEAPAGTSRLRVAACDDIRRAFVCLGHHDRHPDPRYLAARQRLMDEGAAMRNMGAGALQLAHIAAGRYDGFIELYLSAWDACAGLLLVEEAGGFAAPFPYPADAGRELRLGGPLIAGAPGIADALCRIAGVTD